MKLELTDEQIAPLGELLRDALDDLSSEIAATDNPTYRDGLRARRLSVDGVLTQLGPPAGLDSAASNPSSDWRGFEANKGVESTVVPQRTPCEAYSPRPFMRDSKTSLSAITTQFVLVYWLKLRLEGPCPRSGDLSSRTGSRPEVRRSNTPG